MFNNRGVALFIAMALMFLLSIGAIVVLLTAYNYANTTENQIERARALALAEAGINYAYWKLRIGEHDSGDPIVFPCSPLIPPIPIPVGWTFQVALDEDPATGRITIRSTITY